MGERVAKWRSKNYKQLRPQSLPFVTYDDKASFSFYPRDVRHYILPKAMCDPRYLKIFMCNRE